MFCFVRLLPPVLFSLNMKGVAKRTKSALQNVFKTSIFGASILFFYTTSVNAFRAEILQAYKTFVKVYHKRKFYSFDFTVHQGAFELRMRVELSIVLLFLP